MPKKTTKKSAKKPAKKPAKKKSAKKSTTKKPATKKSATKKSAKKKSAKKKSAKKKSAKPIKGTRQPSKYNVFMKAEMERLRNLASKEKKNAPGFNKTVFKQAAENWTKNKIK